MRYCVTSPSLRNLEVDIVNTRSWRRISWMNSKDLKELSYKTNYHIYNVIIKHLVFSNSSLLRIVLWTVSLSHLQSSEREPKRGEIYRRILRPESINTFFFRWRRRGGRDRKGKEVQGQGHRVGLVILESEKDVHSDGLYCIGTITGFPSPKRIKIDRGGSVFRL